MTAAGRSRGSPSESSRRRLARPGDRQRAARAIEIALELTPAVAAEVPVAEALVHDELMALAGEPAPGVLAGQPALVLLAADPVLAPSAADLVAAPRSSTPAGRVPAGREPVGAPT